jgi:hypothetical protein
VRIFIDTECKCHITNPDGAFREFDVEDFNGKCQTYIEGHRYCPPDESYIREDGEVFYGECIVSWKDYAELDAAQRQYEQEQLVDMENALLSTMEVVLLHFMAIYHSAL